MKVKSSNTLLSGLNPQYFWDVDLSGLDEVSSCRLVIERVFSLGDIHEVNLVVDYYGKHKVIEVLCNLSYIDPKTFNFIVKLFTLPPEKFKCHQKQQSKPQHWNS